MLNLDFSAQAIKFLKKLSVKSAKQIKKKLKKCGQTHNRRIQLNFLDTLSAEQTRASIG